MKIQNNYFYSNATLTSQPGTTTQQNNESVTTDQPIKIYKAPLLSKAPVYFGSRSAKIEGLVQAAAFARKYGVKTGLPENAEAIRASVNGELNLGKGKKAKPLSNSEIYAKSEEIKANALEAKAAADAKKAEDAAKIALKSGKKVS
jgi:hypothetical protein